MGNLRLCSQFVAKLLCYWILFIYLFIYIWFDTLVELHAMDVNNFFLRKVGVDVMWNKGLCNS